MSDFTDKELLDFLESENKQARYTGKCVFRLSTTGRGWRLHETMHEEASDDVREAISKVMLARLREEALE